jgi:flavin-dependent dehydrogenase
VADAVDISALDGVTVEGGTFEDPRTAAAWVTLEGTRSADASLTIVDRRGLDGALLEAARTAGAEHHPERVVEVALDGGHATVRTGRARYQGAWVIGADGANSLVRRRLQRPFRRDQLSIASGVFAWGASDTSIVIRFVPRPAGYIWSFPRRDHLAVGICAQADETRAAPLKDVLDRWLTTWPLARGARLQPYAWPIPSLGADDLATESPAGERHLLVGDAAGLVDPITREGIYFALLSGQLAAEALAGPAASAAYAARLRQNVYPEIARAARLKRGFFQGPFTRLMVDALRQSAPVRRVMVDLIAGVQPYRTLKSRLVRTFEWRLAWRLLMLELGLDSAGRGPGPAQRAR